MVRSTAANCALLAGKGRTHATGSLHGTDQGHARLTHGGAHTGAQQEHGSAHLPDQRLAGAQKTGWLQAQDSIAAFGGQGSQRTLSHRHVPGLGRP